jgi:hypothetical protein
MAKTKYGKYFSTGSRPRPEMFGPTGSGMVGLRGIRESFLKSNLSGGGVYCDKPFVMIKGSHVHLYDDYLFFWGSNPRDIDEFDAEIELYMGKENDQEKHLINKPTIVFIPAGIVHCPLKFVKINKPVFFLHIMDHSVEPPGTPRSAH